MLNYGYVVLRAAVARAIIAAGLHPSIGLHHSNDSNPMRLVDDVMEPFRPVIDWTVWNMAQDGVCEVNTESKRKLIQSLYIDVLCDDLNTPVIVAIQKLATSLGQIVDGEKINLILPDLKFEDTELI